MNIVQINATYKTGSTGKIVFDLNELINRSGNNGYVVCGYYNSDNNPNVFYTSQSDPDVQMKKNILISRITGKMGYRFKSVTNDAIKWIDDKNPDIIHLHNIHGDWLQVEYLFHYIKEKKIPVIWTLHDCWAFTGRCSHFEQCGCEKWKTYCHNCPDKHVYPITYFFDYSEKMFQDKKKWFLGVDRMNIVTPSEWLATYVKQSFLGKSTISVIPSGINTTIFYPQENRSCYLKHILNKKIVLGVANSWSERKGLETFIQLDSIIDHDLYQIVMVGLNPKQLKQIPKTIVGLSKTKNQKELAEIYTDAFCYLNCSVLETQGLTTIEALACGTPVIVFNKSAVPECVTQQCGIILDDFSAESIFKAIKRIDYSTNDYRHECREHIIENYSANKQFDKYISLYKKICL